MSLWRWKRTIARAVEGDLSAAQEERLAAHLRTCEACRGVYDRLAATTDALGTLRRSAPGETSVRAAAREEARLRHALSTAPLERPRRQRGRWTWAFVLGPGVAAAALFVGLRVTPPPSRNAPVDSQGGRSADEIVWRGSPEVTGGGAASEVVLAYASRKLPHGQHGPVRLVGEVPGGGELRASSDDYLQLTVRNLTRPAFVAALALDDEGAPRAQVLFPRPGEPAPRLVPDGREAPRPLGPSIDLASVGLSGHLGLCVLMFDEAQPARAADDEAVLAQWVKHCRGDVRAGTSPRRVSGVLIVGR